MINSHDQPNKNADVVRVERFREEWDRQLAALDPLDQEVIVAKPEGHLAERLTRIVEAAIEQPESRL